MYGSTAVLVWWTAALKGGGCEAIQTGCIVAWLNAGRGGAFGWLTAHARAANCCWVTSSACLNSLVEVEIVEMLPLSALALVLFAICICAIDPVMLPMLSSLL